ncbi:MAG: hypothetical protein QOJ64_2712 [Acidobacteriota bacterium]|jgi:hypothetical protein|nr:hypothetical protein [Acidobacteriota bacterium]
MRQPTLFDRPTNRKVVDVEEVVLYALGDFQSRGKVLAGRNLPLDRLRGALRRASEEFNTDEFSDAVAVGIFESLGAEVRRVPSFVAKHPFRIIVPTSLAKRAQRVYEEAIAAQKAAGSTVGSL